MIINKENEVIKNEYLEEAQGRVERKARRRKANSVVCLQDVVLDLMNDWEIELADIQKATDIPWATLHGWIVGGLTPMLGWNILALSRYFNCSINYLVYGIGEEPTNPKDKVREEFDQAAANKGLKR